MVTIKELAEEIGVSKTSITKQIRKLGLQTSLQKSGNKFVIPEDVVIAIKSSFQKNNTTQAQIKSETDMQTISDLICALKLQLKEKDKQIDNLQELLNQQQKLNVIDKQRIVELEEKNTKKHWWNKS